MKKEWTKPKLVVLFRARSDESVLGYCKTIANPSGSQTYFEACNLDDPTAVDCVPVFCMEDVVS